MSVSGPIGLSIGEQPAPSAAERLLTALEGLLRRHRALAQHSGRGELHAELIATEVAHQLAIARLHQPPPR